MVFRWFWGIGRKITIMGFTEKEFSLFSSLYRIYLQDLPEKEKRH